MILVPVFWNCSPINCRPLYNPKLILCQEIHPTRRQSSWECCDFFFDLVAPLTTSSLRTGYQPKRYLYHIGPSSDWTGGWSEDWSSNSSLPHWNHENHPEEQMPKALQTFPTIVGWKGTGKTKYGLRKTSPYCELSFLWLTTSYEKKVLTFPTLSNPNR